MGREGYTLEGDPRARLYVEYLQVIADFRPAVFVMENVKGLLSSKLDGIGLFERIRSDLESPAKAVRREGRDVLRGETATYEIRALTVKECLFGRAADFVVRCEEFGIPQARHRVVLIGVRNDYANRPMKLLERKTPWTVEEVIGGLPPLRSGVSKDEDGAEQWAAAVIELCHPAALRKINGPRAQEIRDALERLPRALRRMSSHGRGSEFVTGEPSGPDWYQDSRLDGYCNHSTRSHIAADLRRYLYAAVYAGIAERSPDLAEFPGFLLPNHANVGEALVGAMFGDRFRVQVANKPSTTITSHISKDGHYYIHYDPAQCRSLTVREAARLQTFPDNYFFEGPRTGQYIQVGNAVPPRLAEQIAASVARLVS
jgi:DNA (cytosine-5)-methyltransferase 1